MSNARELAELGGSYGTGGFVGMKNRIINGGMVVNQRGGTATADAGGTGYPVDRYRIFANGGGVFTGAQSSTVPASGQFRSSALLTVTTADASIASTDYYSFTQYIEGYNVADLMWGTANAQTVTLSFWVNSSVTGTYSIALGNSASDRWYIANYTISSANTWEQKTITVSGDTSGTWLTTNGIGLLARWDLGSGSSFNGTANTWNSSAVLRTSGSVNWIATNGATFYITGVQLEKGSTATSFDYRPYGTELALCQRYYWRNSYTVANTRFGQGVAASTTLIDGAIFTSPVQMRASPTATVSNCNCWDGSANNAITGIGAVYSSPIVMSVALNTTGLTTGRCVQVHSTNNSTAFVSADAEL